MLIYKGVTGRLAFQANDIKWFFNYRGPEMKEKDDRNTVCDCAFDEKISVNDEMIEKGVMAFSWDERFEPIEAAILRAYLAMEKFRRSRHTCGRDQI